MTKDTIRIFVAMPGTFMGENADWKDPNNIKKEFYEKVKDNLQKALDKNVELIIEKDKKISGNIHSSMFSEALISDIYIADLTGNNANVYLELGVRWAMRDKVTIVVSQNVNEVLFNASANRVFEYSMYPTVLNTAIQEITESIIIGLNGSECDSPVRLNSEIVQMSKSELDNLKSELDSLKKNRGMEYYQSGISATNHEDKVEFFNKAIKINPLLIDAYVELGKELRKQSKYDESIEVLCKSTTINNNYVKIHQELGIVYGKIKQFKLAIESLENANKLKPNDAEILRNLGGALRRLALSDVPDSINWGLLEKAKERYQEAVNIDGFNTYGLLNVAKLQLMLSKNDSSLINEAIKNFEISRHLSKATLVKNPKDYWKQFDYADTFILSGKIKTGEKEFEKGVKLIPSEHKASVLISVLSSLNELSQFKVRKDINDSIKQIIKKFEKK